MGATSCGAALAASAGGSLAEDEPPLQTPIQSRKCRIQLEAHRIGRKKLLDWALGERACQTANRRGALLHWCRGAEVHSAHELHTVCSGAQCSGAQCAQCSEQRMLQVHAAGALCECVLL